MKFETAYITHHVCYSSQRFFVLHALGNCRLFIYVQIWHFARLWCVRSVWQFYLAVPQIDPFVPCINNIKQVIKSVIQQVISRRMLSMYQAICKLLPNWTRSWVWINESQSQMLHVVSGVDNVSKIIILSCLPTQTVL